MQYKFFHIPAFDSLEIEAELNRFLRGHTISSVKKKLVIIRDSVHWVFCIEYLQNSNRERESVRERVDYRQVLANEDFAIFSRLRDARRKMAEQEGVPVYTICTNEQLAEMARRRVKSVADVGKIEGIGEAKLAKYGERLVQALHEGHSPPLPPPEPKP